MIPSARMLRKHWKLTAIAVFSLSIAMALGVVGLSLTNTFLFLPPAAPAPDRLVMIHARSDVKAVDQISYPDYQYFRENNHVFTDIAAAPDSIMLTREENFGGREIKVFARPVSDNYLAVMGIHPHLGRLFAPGDEEAGGRVAVMMYSCWTRLGADPNVVGKRIGAYTIIGVAPQEFTGSFYGLNGDLLVPIGRPEFAPAWRTQRDARRLFLLARLKPGVSKRRAQAEMAALSGQLAAEYPNDDKNRTAVITRATLLPPDGLATAELIFGVLMAVVLLVLLIACANVANLLLAVAVGRRQEAAIKLALGAPRGRLIREFLRESAMLCVAGAALGYLIAAAIIARYSDLTLALPMFGVFSLALNLRLDATVIAFALGLMLIAILATGIAPALYASSPALSQVLSGEIVTGGRRKGARRNILVIVQVAVCTLVLVGTGLCRRSLYNLRHVDPGFSARNLIAVQVSPRQDGYPEAKGRELFETLRQTVSALPGVESVSLALNLPLLGDSAVPVQFSDRKEKIRIAHTVVDSAYFTTLGIRILAGRVFDSRDRESSPESLVINRKMAEMFFPGQDPLGKAVTVDDPPRKAIVVGVVADGKYEDLDEPARPFMYSALSQHYQDAINVIARTTGDPRLWITPLTQAVLGLGLPLPMAPVTLDGWMDFTLLSRRIAAVCVAGLSALGLLLAVIGLFGAISYSVRERKKELGIRVALGARPGQLLKMVLRQTLVIAGSGVALGILLGVGATMLLRSRFYAIAAAEWTVLLPVGAVMLGVSLLVAYFSAKPWLSINPMDVVRHA